MSSLWTPQELADYLSVKVQTVLRFARCGIIPPCEKIGGKIIRFSPAKYSPDSLAAWRASHPTPAAEARRGRKTDPAPDPEKKEEEKEEEGGNE